MAAGSSVQLLCNLGVVCRLRRRDQFKSSNLRRHPRVDSLSSCSSRRQDSWSLRISDIIYQPSFCIPNNYCRLICRASSLPAPLQALPLMKSTTAALTQSYNILVASPVSLQVVPAFGVIAFALWGLLPLMRSVRNIICQSDGNWKKSKTYYVSTSYVQPLLLWAGTALVCRALDPVVLSSEASQTVKLRLLNFIKSLSTVVAMAYCVSSFIQQAQNFFKDSSASQDTRNMGFQFAGKVVYTAVWIAAFSLFMELLGFSTQKWVTAGGLGTVLLTLAGREIFTNFLSSVMIHTTRPFVVNEWIQTKIEGYEVSGTVEHIGWWSPTIIRGDDREAVHIPNHKFTVSVVRNLTQKTHWRIKTHFAISHLDVGKINNIVADMRKVLAKNPMIEQQRLHRRVFLENVNPENQALLILVSCFVKTSHFEEYLCVKESVMLDLLRVISHHRARLATPIRTVQKIYSDADIDNIPYSESVYNQTTVRPYLLVDPSHRINGDNRAKLRYATVDEQASKSTAVDAKATPDVTNSNSSENEKLRASEISADEPLAASAKAETDKTTPTPTPRPAFEDNIVLGVALEGSKRTLPIEEGMSSGPGQPDVNEVEKVGSANLVKDRKGQISVSPTQTKLD